MRNAECGIGTSGPANECAGNEYEVHMAEWL
jgi:hypothetical protein